MKEDDLMFFTSNPYLSRTSTIHKIIDIDPCEDIINKEFTIDFCPRCKFKNCQCTSPSTNDCSAIHVTADCNTHNTEKDVNISPCTQYTEETIHSKVESGKLIHIKLNLLHVQLNKKLIVGVLLYNNNNPYAIKIQQVCIDPNLFRRKNRRRIRCTDTTEIFDFILSDCINQNQLNLKIITQYDVSN